MRRKYTIKQIICVLNKLRLPPQFVIYLYKTFSGGEVTTASSVLDYETVPSKLYRLIITASDGKDTSTATMTISVADENERCSFHQNQYLVTADEGPVKQNVPS